MRGVFSQFEERCTQARLGSDLSNSGGTRVQKGVASPSGYAEVLGYDPRAVACPNRLVEEVAMRERAALDLGGAEKACVVALSSLTSNRKTVLPRRVDSLTACVANDAIQSRDYDFLRAGGVSTVLRPGTNLLDATQTAPDLVDRRRRNGRTA